MPYSFEWAVDDEYSGNHYSHREQSDGYRTEGQYAVLLPDGRRQVVTFTSNPHQGYVADVQYEGQPSTGIGRQGKQNFGSAGHY